MSCNYYTAQLQQLGAAINYITHKSQLLQARNADDTRLKHAQETSANFKSKILIRFCRNLQRIELCSVLRKKT